MRGHKKEIQQGRTPGHQDKAITGAEEETLIKKLCKNYNQPFETSNPKRETCSGECRSAFSRRKNN